MDAQLPLPAGSPAPSNVGVARVGHTPLISADYVQRTNPDGSVSWVKTGQFQYKEPVDIAEKKAWYAGVWHSLEWQPRTFQYVQEEIKLDAQGNIASTVKYQVVEKEQWGGPNHLTDWFKPVGTQVARGDASKPLIVFDRTVSMQPVARLPTGAYQYDYTPQGHQYVSVGKNVIDLTMSDATGAWTSGKAGQSRVVISKSLKDDSWVVTPVRGDVRVTNNIDVPVTFTGAWLQNQVALGDYNERVADVKEQYGVNAKGVDPRFFGILSQAQQRDFVAQHPYGYTSVTGELIGLQQQEFILNASSPGDYGGLLGNRSGLENNSANRGIEFADSVSKGTGWNALGSTLKGMLFLSETITDPILNPINEMFPTPESKFRAVVIAAGIGVGVVAPFLLEPIVAPAFSIGGIEIGEFAIGKAALTTAEVGLAAYSVKQAIYEPTGWNVGMAALSLISPGLKAVSFGKTAYMMTKYEYIAPELVTERAVLEGRQTFPMTSGPEDSIGKFNAARTVVGQPRFVTATTSSLSEFSEGVVANAPRWSEDIGLWGAPGGKASTYFLKLNRGEAGYTFRLLPDFRSIVDTPKLIDIGVSSVERIPRVVLEESGISATQPFIESQAGMGKAWIPKRTEIAFDASLPRDGMLSSRELQAVLPPGTQLRFLEGTKWTWFGGRAVPIYRATVVTEEGASGLAEGFGLSTAREESAIEIVGYEPKPRIITPPYEALPSVYQAGLSVKDYPMRSYSVKSFMPNYVMPSYEKAIQYVKLSRYSSPSFDYPSQSYEFKSVTQSYERTSVKYSVGQSSGYPTTTPSDYPMSPPSTREYALPMSIHGVPSMSYSFVFPSGSQKRGKKAFKVQVKRRGKWLNESGPLPFRSALRLGSRKTVGSLAATFRLLPIGETERGDIDFALDARIFRDYAVRRGRRVDLPLTYIQRRGKRLISDAEVSQIQGERRSALAADWLGMVI